jgi:hypothetical protein
MLDIQSFNAKGQPVYWEESINEINSKIRDGYFVPGKYHHVTLAWLESENPIPEQTINKIENALTAANEILKIVYPSGVTGISLMDGAVLLGKSHNALAFRVTESAELQKIQQIILKFISFEQVTGFKFSTFKEETPLHLTLGRIIPSRQGKRYEGIAAAMNAPSGARASQGEDLLINTYRISNPGERDRDWQELKAYAF